MNSETKQFLQDLVALVVFVVLLVELIFIAAMLEPIDPWGTTADPGRSSAVRAPALGAGPVAGSNPAAPTTFEEAQP